MKKIIIVFCALILAHFANAASFKWQSSGAGSKGAIYANATDKLYTVNSGVVVYLFDAAIVSESTLLANLRDKQDISSQSWADHTGIDSSSKITEKTFTYGEVNKTYNFYYAIVNGDNIFISSELSAKGVVSGDTMIDFTSLSSNTKNVFEGASTAYSTAGWYSMKSAVTPGGDPTEGVPEPTSALLGMLGLAGLALKRKNV